MAKATRNIFSASRRVDAFDERGMQILTDNPGMSRAEAKRRAFEELRNEWQAQHDAEW